MMIDRVQSISRIGASMNQPSTLEQDNSEFYRETYAEKKADADFAQDKYTETGLLGLKVLLTLHGGAIVTLFSILSDAWRENAAAMVQTLSDLLIPFSFGISFALLSLLSTALNWFALSSEEFMILNNMTPENARKHEHSKIRYYSINILYYSSISLGILSVIAFIYGLVCSYLIFSNSPSTSLL